MKALFVVTGRGIGGDAVTAINIAKALSKYDFQCEFALDHTAQGLLFKKNGIDGIKPVSHRQGDMLQPKKYL